MRIIGENLLVDPTSVSKEVKKNRIEISVGLKIIVKEPKDGLMFVLAVKTDIIIALYKI